MKNLTRLYFLLLITVTILTSVSTFYSVFLLKHSKGDYTIINTSGKQRMLCQKIILSFSRIEFSNDKLIIDKSLNEAKIAFNEFKHVNKMLIDNDLEQNIFSHNDHEKYDSIFSCHYKIIEKNFTNFSKIITLYSNKSEDNFEDTKSILLQIISDEEELIGSIDEVTSIFESTAEDHISHLIIWLLVLYGLTLITLFSQAIFIFKPSIQGLKAAFQTLNNTKFELQETNKVKDKFFSIIAHDLKNPFNAIMLASSSLMKKRGIYTEEKVFEYVNMINLSANTAHNLLENLLLWSKTQTNKISPVFENINLKLIVDENIDLMHNNSELKNINLKNHITDDIYCVADFNMIRTVVRNLINNAIKFTPSNGVINISHNTFDNKIEVIVSDNGIGIKSEDLNKIGDLKESFHTNGTNGEQGTGLGLVLCKDFIELNNGTFNINSTYGIGTSVSFILKASDKNNSSNTSVKISENIKNQADVDFSILNNLTPEISTLWKELTVKQSISKIDRFGNLLIETGTFNNLEIIKQYGDELLNAKKEFDIEKIIKLINKFPSVVESIQNLQSTK